MSVAEPLAPANLQGRWKRRGSEEEDEDSNSNVKKARYSWYVTLESESPQPTSSDEDESIYSIQAQETEYVQDTSDTSTWVTSADDVTDEFEPVALSVDNNPFIDCLSSSDPELQISQHIVGYVGAIAAAAALCDSDVDLADDSDDSLTSRDSEISHADYWTCVQCNNKNNKPLFRYCERCYQVRKQFLPPRPKGKKRRKEIKKRWSRRGARALEGGGSSLVSQDSGLGSSLGSQSTISFDLKTVEFKSEIASDSSMLVCSSQESVDTGFSSCLSQTASSSGGSLISPQPGTSSQSDKVAEKSQQKCSKRRDEKVASELELGPASQESQESTAATLLLSNQSDSSDDENAAFAEKIRQSALKAKAQKNDEDNKLCLICTVGPKNGAFVHGRDLHIYCCYRCAMRVWKTTKQCPICNRKVTDVLKAYFA